MNGNEAGAHLDESDLLRAHMDSGIALAKAGRARLRLALPHHRDLVVSNHSLAFRTLCIAYEVAALTKTSARKSPAARNFWRNMKNYAAA
ncbi:hypothetical protein [Sinorhizobium garamanticum]|uniref:hypothetical protein n=1 Tax=Sinorhizobium garamanticum TaxID=680247 RepID=UPI00314517D2